MKIRAASWSCVFLLTGCLTPTGTQAPVGVVTYGANAGGGSTGMHTVLEGDTVYTVSKQYNLPLREIITVNDLSAPYTLTYGYRLKLPPPNEYKVKGGDTLNGVSRLFNVSLSEVARMNNIAAPYAINKGQVLRLPTPQPKLEQELASAAPMPSFDTDAQAGEQTSVPVKVAGVESEVLPPPPGMEQKTPAQPIPVSTSAATSFPPQPVPNSAQTSAKVEPAVAKSPTTMPKTPPRTGRFMRPVDGKIISGYGPKEGGLHNDGINIKAAKGTAVRAAENGVVAYTGNEMAGYGNLILIRHADRWMTAYAHMDKILVKKGDVVSAGQTVGTVGATGQVDSPQLHFEVRKGTQAEDPAKHL